MFNDSIRNVDRTERRLTLEIVVPDDDLLLT